MIVGHRAVSVKSHIPLDRCRGGPISPHLFSSPALRHVRCNDTEMRLSFDHKELSPPLALVGDVQAIRWDIDMAVRGVLASIVVGERIWPVSAFSMDFDRNMVELDWPSNTSEKAACCGVGHKGRCPKWCPRLKLAKKIRRKATRSAARSFGMSNFDARHWKWNDDAAFRKAVMDREKYERSRLGLCWHSMPERACSCSAGSRGELGIALNKTINTTIRMRIMLPAVDAPRWMRQLQVEAQPQGWVSRSGRAVYGWKGEGEGMWTSSGDKLERRRVRSRISTRTRQWPIVPTHFQKAIVEFDAVVSEVTISVTDQARSNQVVAMIDRSTMSIRSV
jgi:hypothetical protein